jgi:murein DD-endopeptidase MepM/ murein hydrolase activator NlpD
MRPGTRARRLIGVGLLAAGFQASPSVVLADPPALKHVGTQRSVPEERYVGRSSAKRALVSAKEGAVPPRALKRASGRRARMERPCSPRVGRAAIARVSYRSGSRPRAIARTNRLGRAWVSWSSRAIRGPCVERFAYRPPMFEPSILTDGSLLAAVGPARIPTRLYLGIPDLPPESTTFAWPVLGSVVSIFGQRGFGWHAGVDIKAETGTPVVAAAPGVVYASGWEGSYGWVVKIDHKDGFSTIYAHNLQNLVEPGQAVEAGSVIALVGRTGRASGPHLHFEIRRDGMAYNPLFLLLPQGPHPPDSGETAAVYPAIDSGDEDGVE